MYFSELQQKEIIDARSGELLGYIEDAEVDVENGKIVFFIVTDAKKFYHVLQREKKQSKFISMTFLTSEKMSSLYLENDVVQWT